MINTATYKKINALLFITFLSVSSVVVADTSASNVFEECDQQQNKYLEKEINQKIKSMDPIEAKAFVTAHAQALAQAHLCAYQQQQNVRNKKSGEDHPSALSAQPLSVVQESES